MATTTHPNWIDTPRLRFGIIDAVSDRFISIVDGYVQGTDGQAYGVSVTNKDTLRRFQFDLEIDGTDRGKFIVFPGSTFVMKTPLESTREFVMAAKAGSAIGASVGINAAGVVRIKGQFEKPSPVKAPRTLESSLSPPFLESVAGDGTTGSLVPGTTTNFACPGPVLMRQHTGGWGNGDGDGDGESAAPAPAPGSFATAGGAGRRRAAAPRAAPAPRAAVTELGRDTGKSYTRIATLETSGAVTDMSLRLAIKPSPSIVVPPAPPLE